MGPRSFFLEDEYTAIPTEDTMAVKNVTQNLCQIDTRESRVCFAIPRLGGTYLSPILVGSVSYRTDTWKEKNPFAALPVMSEDQASTDMFSNHSRRRLSVVSIFLCNKSKVQLTHAFHKDAEKCDHEVSILSDTVSEERDRAFRCTYLNKS
jgi:hypothetical protein